MASANSCRDLFLNEKTFIFFEADTKSSPRRSDEKRDQWTREGIESSLAMFRSLGLLVPPFITVKRTYTYSTAAKLRNTDLNIDYVDFFQNEGKTPNEITFKGVVAHEIGHIVLNWNIEFYAPKFTSLFEAADPEINRREWNRLFRLVSPYHELFADVTRLISRSPLLLMRKYRDEDSMNYRRFESRFPLPWEELKSVHFWEPNFRKVSDNFQAKSQGNLAYIRLAAVRRYIYRSHPYHPDLVKSILRAIGRELDSLVEEQDGSRTDRELNRRLIDLLQEEFA